MSSVEASPVLSLSGETSLIPGARQHLSVYWLVSIDARSSRHAAVRDWGPRISSKRTQRTPLPARGRPTIWDHVVKLIRWQHPAIRRGARFSLPDSNYLRILLHNYNISPTLCVLLINSIATLMRGSASNLVKEVAPTIWSRLLLDIKHSPTILAFYFQAPSGYTLLHGSSILHQCFCHL